MGSHIVKCEAIEPGMRKRYDRGIVMLEETVARNMVSKGLVKIIDERHPKPKAAEVKQPDYITRTMWPSGSPRVAWVQDNSRPHGGAELSNRVVVEAGEKIGAAIVGVTPTTFNREILETADMVVVNNVWEFGEADMRVLRRVLYDERIPYVKYDHDYRELKRVNVSRQLFWMARRCVFISPAHERRTVAALGIDKDKAITLPLAVEGFNGTGQAVPRNAGTVLVPTLRKGPKAMAAHMVENGKREYSIVGGGSVEAPGVKTVGLPATDIAGMEKYYRSHQYMLHLPEEPWAGERVYFESILCGCEPIVNDNVGHVSWGFDVRDVDGIRETLTAAPYRFWHQILDTIHK